MAAIRMPEYRLAPAAMSELAAPAGLHVELDPVLSSGLLPSGIARALKTQTPVATRAPVPKMPNRRRTSCIHEAGHALARWYFGFPTDRAVVLTREEIRAGKRVRGRDGNLITCHGMVSGPPVLEWPYRREAGILGAGTGSGSDRWWMYRRDVDLIILYAGFHAHAHHARIHPNAAALGGGGSDVGRFASILKAWSLRPGEDAYDYLEARVATWTRALVRSPQGASAIRAIADALMARGRLSGTQIASLCRHAYDGRECAFEAWAAHWPPTAKQLREGFVPGDART